MEHGQFIIDEMGPGLDGRWDVATAYYGVDGFSVVVVRRTRTRDGRWEMGDGRWEVVDGRW
jgi:hypothetical protein